MICPKSIENRSQHPVNIKPIHVKIESTSIQKPLDINTHSLSWICAFYHGFVHSKWLPVCKQRNQHHLDQWCSRPPQDLHRLDRLCADKMLQTYDCWWANLSMWVAIEVNINDLNCPKSLENRSQRPVNIKPIHGKIEPKSIQNRLDINLHSLSWICAFYHGFVHSK